MVGRAVAVFLLAASPALAAPPHYVIDPAKSRLAFAAVENNAEVSGHFATFSGDIVFDPKALAQSHIAATVDVASVTSDTNDMAETLIGAEWFNIAQFPKATFESHDIAALGGNRYTAKGMLTIKGSAQPVTLNFTLDTVDAAHASATGDAQLSRNAFHVGWAETKQVADVVKVTFTIAAQTK